MIRVFVVGEPGARRDALAAVLTRDPGLMLATAASDADALLADARDLTNLRPGDPPAILIGELAREPRGVSADSPAFEAGPHGLLGRDATPDEITAAIRAVVAGLIVRLPAVRDAVSERRGAASDQRREALSQRERSVLQQLASGASNRRIAESLGISEHTVKTHLAAIFAKLGATSRTEAVTQGVRLGLVML